MSTKQENNWTWDQLHVAELRNYNKRFTKEDNKNTEGEDYREGPHSNLTNVVEQSKRISHNFWFPKAIMVNEDILEILSSLLSNGIHAEYFELSINEIWIL